MLAMTLLGAVALVPRDVAAHFVMEEPAASRSQDGLGNPQKLGPCGDEAGGTDTGEVTAFQTGQTLTITIRETIFHPGHYRIALSVNDRSELPPEPIVTPGSTPCGSAPIQDPPVFPVLADGVLVHTTPLSGPQTIDVQLPAGVTCDHCTLQVIEFMSNHPLNDPGGCYYHHCADISIHDVVVDTDTGTEDSGVAPRMDAGVSTGMDAGTAAATPASCACGVTGRRSTGWAGLTAMPLAALIAWRRRRARRPAHS